ncbi:ATP-binding protein [Streptomyces sp. H10-C2]|uniref:ATP-binding protein n=1 Tax=unclassified Streptomyces TaxID=2593676 RepID=UPI0024BA46DB|nr:MULTISPECIES: ATP-binding protein [unclassified Streptomyces]MDJ0344957.1 ATP-binding protein [Streptomyces sp. PH10-H1]MDJ0373962.1 ATP-binding protein [Streptomyces sp. H10-C2]
MHIYRNNHQRTCVLPFGGDPGEIAGLRRVVRLQLKVWGNAELAHPVALAVTELAANAVNHVGHGAPATLVMHLDDDTLRLELHDGSPQPPAATEPSPDDECGRGLLILAAITSDWGSLRTTAGKLVWCEFALPKSGQRRRLQRASVALESYACESGIPVLLTRGTPVLEEAATDLIADLLYWLTVQGLDPDDVLDRAQMHFEAESAEA